MTSLEFNEWFVFMAREQLLPDADRLRHGQLVAAGYNSGDLRPGNRNWAISDFVDSDVWEAIAEPEPPKSIAEQVAMLNSWRE